jgi:hypothetical protein
MLMLKLLVHDGRVRRIAGTATDRIGAIPRGPGDLFSLVRHPRWHSIADRIALLSNLVMNRPAGSGGTTAQKEHARYAARHPDEKGPAPTPALLAPGR